MRVLASEATESAVRIGVEIIGRSPDAGSNSYKGGKCHCPGLRARNFRDFSLRYMDTFARLTTIRHP